MVMHLKISIENPCRKHDRQAYTICAVSHSPINADGTEIEDAGCTHHHIQSDKDVTVDLAKAPLSHYLEEKKHQQMAVYSNSQQNKAAALPQKRQHLGRNDVFYFCNRKQS